MTRYYVNRLWCWFRHWTCTHSTRYWILGMQHASLSYSAISIYSPFIIWSRPVSSIVLLHASWTVYIPSPRFFHVAFPNKHTTRSCFMNLHVKKKHQPPPPPTKNTNIPWPYWLSLRTILPFWTYGYPIPFHLKPSRFQCLTPLCSQWTGRAL